MRLSGSEVYQRTPVPKMPPGLVELLEGLTRDVLKNNPPNVYEFCANHMQKLLEIRDGPSRMKKIPLDQKIKNAQEVVRKRAEQASRSKDNTNSPNSNNIIRQKLLNPVHHDNDLANCSEIEISFQPGAMGNDEQGKYADRKEAEDLKELEPLGDLSSAADVKVNDIHSDHIKNSNDKDTDLSYNVDIEENLKDKEVENLHEKGKMEMTKSIQYNDQSENFKNIEPKMEKLVVQNLTENYKIKTTDLDADIVPKPEEIADDKNTQNNNDVKDVTDQSSQNSVQKTINVSYDNSNNKIKLSDYKNVTDAENHNHELKNQSSEIHDSSTIDGALNDIQAKQVMITGSNISLSVPNITIDEQNQEHVMKTDVQDNNIFTNNTLEVQNKDMSITSISKADQNANMSSLSLKENEEVCPGSDKPIETIEYKSHSSVATGKEEKSPDQENKPGTIPLKEDSVELKSDQYNEDMEDKLENPEKDVEHKNENNIVKFTDQSREVIEDIELNQQGNINPHSNSDTLQENDDTAKTITVSRELPDISSKESAEEYEKKLSENIAGQESKTPDDYIPTEISDTTKVDVEETIPSKRDFKQLTDGKTLESFQENNIQKTDTVKSDATEESSSVEVAIASGETDCFEDKSTNDSVNNMDLETAAVTIQKVFRTFLFKSRASTFDDSTNEDNNLSDDDNDQDNKEARSFLTSTNKDRRTLGISRMDTVLQTVNEEKSLSLSTDDSSTLSSAATIIQAHVRGFLVRNKFNSGKTASSTNSLINSDGPSTTSLDGDGDQHKTKTILNIHIVPEGNNFLSRDESMITSTDLSLDGSPPSSVNLHPLGYDKSERRKQLKREDAIQSVSPPSNNSGKLSEDVESVKELPSNNGSLANASLDQDTAAAILCKEFIKHESNIYSNDISNTENATKHVKLSEDIELDNPLSSNGTHTLLEEATAASLKISDEIKEFINQESKIDSKTTESTNSNEVESVIETHNTKRASSPEPVLEASDKAKKTLTKQSSDEADVVTPYKGNTPRDSDTSSRLLHSGEFHDSVLPTKVSRSDTPVASGE